ncbi:MAG: hypothetical protein IKS23_03545 [Alphaproteobacteria bacterium]|nr:hypothetical protein [Alphaproteobacteria bacterium]
MDDYEKDLRKAYINALESAIKAPYESASNFGEFVADGLIAYDFLRQMKDTNKKLINKYGKNVGAADGTDDYYHPMLQCYLSKISPESEVNGITLGNLKEVADYIRKIPFNKHYKIIKDSKKDLQKIHLVVI